MRKKEDRHSHTRREKERERENERYVIIIITTTRSLCSKQDVFSQSKVCLFASKFAHVDTIKRALHYFCKETGSAARPSPYLFRAALFVVV